MFYRTRLDWLWQWRCRYNTDTTRVTLFDHHDHQQPDTISFFFFSLFIPAKALAKLFACDANKLNKKNELRKTRSTETQLITICLATYVQRRIERREKLPPRKVPTHLEITGKKSVTNGVPWDVWTGSRITCMVSTTFCTSQRYFYRFLSFFPFFFSFR